MTWSRMATEYTFADPTTGEILGNPYDDDFAFTTDPGEVARRVGNAGRTWAEAEAVVDLLERQERALVADISSKIRGVSRSATDAKHHVGRNEKVIAIGEQVEHARNVARHARIHYDTIQIWAKLLQTKWSTDRELAKIR